MKVARFDRQEFLEERWHYRPGEHASFITATQNGKTTMMFDLLRHTDTSWCTIPPTVLVAKPKDKTVADSLIQAGYQETAEWPPVKKLFAEKPTGYGFWPRHLRNADEETNNAHLAKSFRPVVHELFWRGNTILVADEQYHLCAVLNMQSQMTRHWTQGMGMGSGLWSATQKPSGTQQGTIPSFMYNSPTHIFLGRELDEANRKRFGEIGGVNPKLVRQTVEELDRFEWLYIHRDGPLMCVIKR